MADRSIKSAERTLALFEFFSREQDSFTVGSISQALQMPQASASMLLRNLTNLGYLEYDRVARTYAPSIRVALLGSWVGHRFGAAGDLGARVSELHETFGETAFIGIQNGASAQYVLAKGNDRPDRLVVASGQFRSLTFSAMGRALLALLPDPDMLMWVRRCNADAADPRFQVSPSAFLAITGNVRAEGYAETRGDVTPGLGAIAVSIKPPMGHQPLALGIGGPLDIIEQQREAIVAELLSIKRYFAGPS